MTSLQHNAWSTAFACQKRIIRDLFSQNAQLTAQSEKLLSQVQELRSENRELSKRVAAVEKGQIVDLKRLEQALGVPDDDGGEDES